ncbi:uncharacterized protein LOC133876699 [Alnus glutinosa]|uniref:uncharacterized protein LOC133876699 n=1 Tax=Alnus glutinosa TaxID=3517 RepID=UPI002D76C169|nr:uncharacterized protein LOC133876699 [Alnus glutinosa]
MECIVSYPARVLSVINIGFGCVARDWMGNFLGAKCSFQRITVDPKIVETMSALHAINFGIVGGWSDVVFEGDSLQAVRDLTKPPPHLQRNGHFVEAVQQLLGSLRSSTIVHCPREENGVAHCLAKEGAVKCCNVVWFEDPPPLIYNLLVRECVVPKP